MKIIKGDIWQYHKEDAYIGITTNGCVKNNGELVMGAGIAKQAAERFPELAMTLGCHVKLYGNTVCWLEKYRIFTFPVKHHWQDKADLNLIEESSETIADKFVEGYTLGESFPKLYLPKPGCGNGHLNWEQVEPVLHAYLEGLVTIVDWSNYDDRRTF